MAGTSESQLIKHFSGKAGLLDAIFVSGWSSISGWLNERLAAMSPVDRLRALPGLLFEALDRDPDLRQLLLLEGRRIRKEGRLSTYTDGFSGLAEMVDSILKEIEAAGLIRQGLNPKAIRAALIGLTEGALRDQLLAERAGHPVEFEPGDIGALTGALVDLVVAERVGSRA
jgi:AcrR family transcriptional regulator